MVLGKLDNHIQMNETGLLSYTPQKINSKRIKDLNIRSEVIQLLEDNIGENFFDFGPGNNFVDMTLNVQAAKAKISK